MSTIDLFLTDIDGVVRHFDRSVVDTLEARHRLDPGSLRSAAFDHPRGQLAVTGGLTRAEWIAEVGEATGSARAAEDWLGIAGSTWGRADHAVVDLIEAVRSAGVAVAALTNGTDTIHRELADVGLSDTFDRVFCSWHMGVAKPDTEVYITVCEAMGVSPDRVFFVDDSDDNVAGAVEAGLRSVAFSGVDHLRTTLRSAGLDV